MIVVTLLEWPRSVHPDSRRRLFLLILPATPGGGRFHEQPDELPGTARASLPKLDFSEGIPADCATMVAVPTLLVEREAGPAARPWISRFAFSPTAIPTCTSRC